MSASAASGRRSQPSPPSPLDPFLASMLASIGRQPAGYAPVSEHQTLAATHDWQPAFVDVLLTSAQRRGLVEAFYPKGARGRTRWRLSRRGLAFLADRGVTDMPPPPTD
jgi:hypothetical protein